MMINKQHHKKIIHYQLNQSSLNDVEIVITGYEDKALACRDEILKLIQEFESTITMEIEIDHRIHARIIGTGGQKLQQIMKEYDVEIKFPIIIKVIKYMLLVQIKKKLMLVLIIY